MIRYNLTLLYKLTKNDCDKILNYFIQQWGGIEMDNLSLRIYAAKEKSSFILNETDLLINNINATKYEMCIYIYLAGLRNYLDYYTNGRTWLPLEHTSLNISKIKNNRLITITDEKILLLYEQ